MTTRSIKDWATAIGNADASDCGDATAAARRIIADLYGYNHKSKHRANDTAELANAIQAYALLLQKAGVTVVEA